jgi:Phospholipase_D-nuclease N-terminal
MSLPLAIASWVYPVGVVVVVLWAIALVDLFRRWSELDRRQHSAWLLLIVLVPIVGSILYLASRSR